MNKKEIMNLVKDGTIGVEDALKLIDALEEDEEIAPAVSRKSTGGVKMLKVIIDSKEHGKNSKVRINIPTTFLRMAAKAGKSMDINGVNLSDKIDIDLVMKAIDDGILGEIVNIESDDANVVVVIE